MRARRMQEYADAAKPEVQILSPRRLIHSETLSRLSGISSRPATCACKVLNARHGSEVSILCPQGCFEGSRGCQYHAAGHRQLQFTCQRGGLHGQGVREWNDGCLSHRGNGLEGVATSTLLQQTAKDFILKTAVEVRSQESGVRRKAGYGASAFHQGRGSLARAQGRGSLARAPLGECYFRPLHRFCSRCIKTFALSSGDLRKFLQGSVLAQGGRHADLAARGAEAVTTRLGKFVNESVASQQMNLNSAVGSLGIELAPIFRQKPGRFKMYYYGRYRFLVTHSTRAPAGSQCACGRGALWVRGA